MKRNTKYPCPNCISKNIEPITENPKFDSGNIFGFSASDYRSLPTWKCKDCNFHWNNYNKRVVKLDSGLTGIAGEYLVAGELSRRGYVASITLRNTRGIDITATNKDASKSVGIQVKASTKIQRNWILNKKGEDFYSDTLFYVFVNLKNINERPEFFIVPSKVVADYIKHGHAEWLKTPSKKGDPHRDTTIRQFSDREGNYLERWDLLDLD